jgi:hypothetical protein
MSKYFHIAQGMRGCYMPDNSYVVRVDTRRELKAIVESEARDLRDAGMVGASKREVTATVADAWRNLRAAKLSPYPFVVPYGVRAGGHRPYAIHIGHATREDWLEDQADA